VIIPEEDADQVALPPEEAQPEQSKPTDQAEPEEAPAKEPKAPVDPFDLAQLPGEKTNPESAPSSATQSPESGTHGAEGVESSVVDVYRAFLKWIPEAARQDPTWRSLPVGDAGRIEFIMTIDEKEQLGPIQIVEDKRFPAPAHLKRALPLARRFLVNQRVAYGAQGKGGTQRLALTAIVHQRAPDPNTPEQAGVRKYGIKGGLRPTGVFFTYYSGLHIEIEMWRLP
jgi:hypothetical protein